MGVYQSRQYRAVRRVDNARGLVARRQGGGGPGVDNRISRYRDRAVLYITASVAGHREDVAVEDEKVRADACRIRHVRSLRAVDIVPADDRGEHP
jgi:hypothetical protein